MNDVVRPTDNQSDESVTETTNEELSVDRPGTSISIRKPIEDNNENGKISDITSEENTTICSIYSFIKTKKIVLISIYLLLFVILALIAFILPSTAFTYNDAFERLKDDLISLAANTKFLMCPPEGKIVLAHISVM